MPVLAAERDGRILDLVMAALSDIEAGHDVWNRIFAELMPTFGVTLGGVLDVAGPALETRTILAWPRWATRIEVTSEENSAYPLLRHFGRRADAQPRTLGEVADECRWRTSGRYARMRRQFGGANHHLMLPLRRGGNSVRLFGIARPGRDFTAAERQYAHRLQSVLSGLDRHQQTMATWRAGCATDPEAAAGHAADLGITPRELAVLTLLAEGMTVGQVGRRLGISPRTVAKHQENLRRKLASTDRLNTVLRAQRLGLVPV